MVFKCQEDSFLKEFTTEVLKCEASKGQIVEYGKTSQFEGYEITLKDTIIFPAGGGQPHDLGFLNDIEVLQVTRKGREALHFTKTPIEPGTVVTQKIDWARRFDHMQQHSGQHLLSAILDKHGIHTTSWWLGADDSYIELDTATLKEDIIAKVEEICNEHIQNNLPVVVKVKNINDVNSNELMRQTTGLPEDCVETIRIICIGDVDENMCCGTHVSSLGQLQAIKLLGVENGKKGKCILRFVVGERVLKTLQRCLNRERAMTSLLNTDSTKHADVVESLQRKFKTLNKNMKSVLAELAQYEVEKFKRSEEKQKYAFIFKKEGSADFNHIVQKGLENEGIFVFIASEDYERPREGQVIMLGPEEHCEHLGKQICELLQCKGAFKNGKFQGKATNISAVPKCEKLAREYFEKL